MTTRYLRGTAIDQLFARTDSAGTAAHYFIDHLGSVRHVTDNTGALQNTISYDAWGKITSESTPTFGDRYKWTSREWDAEIDLQYNRARYYDPAIGRWTSEDPIGFAAGDANLYRYVANRPTLEGDPSGLQQRGTGLPTPGTNEAKVPPVGIKQDPRLIFAASKKARHKIAVEGDGGSFDSELFWQNVQKISPEVKHWWDKQLYGGPKGQFSPRLIRRPWNLWLGTTADDGTVENKRVKVFLSTDYDELEAAKRFVQIVMTDWDLHGKWSARMFTNLKAFKVSDGQKWKEEWLAKASRTAGFGANTVLGAYSVLNSGFGWVLTVNDIAKNGLTPDSLVGAIRALPIARAGSITFRRGNRAVYKFTAREARLIAKDGCFIAGTRTVAKLVCDDNSRMEIRRHGHFEHLNWMALTLGITLAGGLTIRRAARRRRPTAPKSND